MNRIRILSYVLMGVAVALALFLAWRYQDLRKTVRDQRYEISHNAGVLRDMEERLRTGEEEIDRNNRELKMSKSSLAAVQSASNYVQDGGYEIVNIGKRARIICEQGMSDDLVVAFCESSRPSIDLMILLTKALQTRIAAPQSDGYGKMRQDYQAIVRYLGGRPGTGGWQAVADEGIAYADMKRDKLPDAERRIARVVRLNPADAGAAVTALKIQCVAHHPEAEVKDAFSQLVLRTNRANAAGSSDNVRGRARREGALFLHDAELYELCDYAGLQLAVPAAAAASR